MDRPYSEEVPKLSKDREAYLIEQVHDLWGGLEGFKNCEFANLQERVAELEDNLSSWLSTIHRAVVRAEKLGDRLGERILYLEGVCEQCILEHQGRGP